MPHVTQNVWSCGTLIVSVFYKTFSKEVVGKYTKLWDAIPVAENFEVDPTIMHVLEKIVYINESLRDVAGFDAEILGVVQWILDITVAGVKGDVLGALTREDTDEYKF